MLFEQERTWTEQAMAQMGLRVVTCFLVPEKARDICAQYHDQSGQLREIVISCLPHMTYSDIEAQVRRAAGAASN
jgi:hypothetical protein